MKIDDTGGLSLQDAFKKFRKKRIGQIKATHEMNEKLLYDPADIRKADLLRTKFLNQAMKYIGVPYAKRYHEKGSDDYDAPLFLDCCGLVRRVLDDLKDDFGFKIGRWNQGYQFDTLPIILSKEEDLKPGDLVFISGTYFKPNRKKQKHDMVHVEIWMGDGQKTIGARYQKGRIQMHDSYKFVSKSYYNMVYHFKSIDTWLRGICRSFCSEHAWKQSKYINHGKHSIFSAEENSDSESAGDSDEDDADHDHYDDVSINCDLTLHTSSTSNENTSARSCIEDDGIANDADDMPLQCIPMCNCIGDCTCLCFECSVMKSCENFVLENTVACSEGKAEEQLESKCAKEPSTEDQLTEGQFAEELLAEEFHAAKQCVEMLNAKESDLKESKQSAEEHSMKELSIDKLALDTNDAEELILNEFDAKPLNVAERIVDNKKDISDLSCGRIRNCAPGDKSKTGKSTRLGKQPSPNGMQSSSAQNNRNRRSRSKSPSKSPSKPLATLASTSSGGQRKSAPKFYIGGHNGVALVEKPLLEMGWERITDNKDLSYYLKWVECKSQIDYKSFKEGEQIVNHIPNGSCLTSKHGLLQTLTEYERITNRKATDSTSKINLCDFFPETYNIDNRQEIDHFCSIYKAGETWICKPSGSNQGKGIFLVRSLEQLKRELADRSARSTRRSSGRVISRYLTNPLLLNECKFDIRAYMLIASTTPYMVYYHPGYVRTSCVEFSNDSNDITTHLTNQYIQKKHPEYSKKNDSTVWSMERFNEYIQLTYKDEKKLPDNWGKDELTHRIKEIMLLCFRAAQNKLQRRCGYFDLLGFDFMIDEDMRVWLIEINVNPALFTNSASLQEVIPGVVDETLKISIEAFENKCSKKRINRLTSVKNFELLYDGERNVSFRRPKVSQPLIETNSCEESAGNPTQSQTLETKDGGVIDGIQ